jgi:hypothetical protein
MASPVRHRPLCFVKLTKSQTGSGQSRQAPKWSSLTQTRDGPPSIRACPPGALRRLPEVPSLWLRHRGSSAAVWHTKCPCLGRPELAIPSPSWSRWSFKCRRRQGSLTPSFLHVAPRQSTLHSPTHTCLGMAQLSSSQSPYTQTPPGLSCVPDLAGNLAAVQDGVAGRALIYQVLRPKCRQSLENLDHHLLSAPSWPFPVYSEISAPV